MKHALKISFSIFVLSVLSACASQPLNDQKLYWKPTEGLGAVDIGALAKYKFKIVGFEDERIVNPKNKIGENVERQQTKLVTADTYNFAPFITTHVTETLQKAGMNIVDSGETYTLIGAVKDFQVTESNKYAASTTIRYILKKGNTDVFSFVVTTSAERFGASYRMENYMEVLSDALMESAKKLATSDLFRGAVESNATKKK